MAKQLNRVISEKKDFSNLVSVWKVSDFRDEAFVGGLYTGHKNENLILLKKHPFIAEPHKGCFQWTDLYMWKVRKTDTIADDYAFYYKEG